MTEENLNEVKVEEKKECNCPVCKLLKSDCTKKFLGVVLASFIGCSLAILAFAPKKPPCWKKMCPPPYHRMMPMPPMHHQGQFHKGMHPDFYKYKMRKGEFKHHEGLKRPDFQKRDALKPPYENKQVNKVDIQQPEIE